MRKAFVRPATIQVYCTVEPTKRNGLKVKHTHRVANCNDESEIAGIIARDRNAMTNTFGGLIDSPGIAGRSYRAFRAEWTEIAV